jgi:hypothetical protein
MHTKSHPHNLPATIHPSLSNNNINGAGQIGHHKMSLLSPGTKDGEIQTLDTTNNSMQYQCLRTPYTQYPPNLQQLLLGFTPPPLQQLLPSFTPPSLPPIPQNPQQYQNPPRPTILSRSTHSKSKPQTTPTTS